MALLDVTEYQFLAQDTNKRPLLVGAYPPAAQQQVAVGGVSTATTNALSNDTRFVRLHTDTTCRIAIGSRGATTATATSPRMVANTTEFFSVPPGGDVAVITSA